MTLYLKLAIAAAILAALWGLHHYIDKGGYDRRVAEENAAIIKATKENDALKSRLEDDHAKSIAALNVLLDTPAPRVRIPTCPQTTSPTGIQVPDATGQRTDLGNQEVLDRITNRLDSKAAEWSRALSACKVVMEWANRSR